MAAAVGFVKTTALLKFINMFLIASYSVLLLLSAFAFRFLRELEDEIARGNRPNLSLFPNSNVAATAKWIYPFKPYVKKWYYFGIITPPQAERFPLSSTLLVWTTDTEHFLQFMQTLCIFMMAAASHLLPSLCLSLFFIGFGFVFAQLLKERNPDIT